MKPVSVLAKTAGALFFLCLILACLIPFLLLPLMASYNTDDLMRQLPFWFGSDFFTNIQTLMHTNFLQTYWNSFLVSAGTITLSIFAGVLAAYAIAKFRFKGQKFLFGMVMLTMMIPGQISTVGYIMEMRAMNLVNTLWPLIFTWVAHPFTCFFLIQFIRSSVPNEIMESGRIDGASEPRILWSLVLPFIRPGLSTTVILLFLWSWNNYTLPMLVINANDKFTIPLFVSNLISEFRFDIGGRMAALSLAVFPVLILYAIFSKSFIEGIAAGSVKG